MRYLIKYLLFCSWAVICVSCNSEEKYDFVLQTNDGKNLKVGTTISYLGIQVGEVVEINFSSVNNEDVVVAAIQLNKEGILNESSYLQWSEYDVLEIINANNGKQLTLGDTLHLMEKSANMILEEKNVIDPISTQKLTPNEQELLSPEDQEKLDSLQEKINKLNNLIKEVNDQN